MEQAIYRELIMTGVDAKDSEDALRQVGTERQNEGADFVGRIDIDRQCAAGRNTRCKRTAAVVRRVKLCRILLFRQCYTRNRDDGLGRERRREGGCIQ